MRRVCTVILQLSQLDGHANFGGLVALSSGIGDLFKNTALSWMRLHGLLGILRKFSGTLRPGLQEKKMKKKLLNLGLIAEWVDADSPSPSQSIKEILTTAADVIKKYISFFPADRDVAAFGKGLEALEQDLKVLH